MIICFNPISGSFIFIISAAPGVIITHICVLLGGPGLDGPPPPPDGMVVVVVVVVGVSEVVKLYVPSVWKLPSWS